MQVRRDPQNLDVFIIDGVHIRPGETFKFENGVDCRNDDGELWITEPWEGKLDVSRVRGAIRQMERPKMMIIDDMEADLHLVRHPELDWKPADVIKKTLLQRIRLAIRRNKP